MTPYKGWMVDKPKVNHHEPLDVLHMYMYQRMSDTNLIWRQGVHLPWLQYRDQRISTVWFRENKNLLQLRCAVQWAGLWSWGVTPRLKCTAQWGWRGAMWPRRNLVHRIWLIQQQKTGYWWRVTCLWTTSYWCCSRVGVATIRNGKETTDHLTIIANTANGQLKEPTTM